MPGSKPDPLAALIWLADAGADEAIGESPPNWLSVPVPATRSLSSRTGPPIEGSSPFGTGRPEHKPPAPSGALPFRTTKPTTSAPVSTDAPSSGAIGSAMELAAACASLDELRSAIESYDGCSLKKSATTTVFADGTARYKIMLIGEAPGREEDLAGLPFVGRAGKLLDKMLASIGLDRKTNVYITNVLNWRPPGNRDPSPEESASCLPFLRRHIELVAPEIIILLGAVSTRQVMGLSDGIMRLRGKWLEYYVNGCMVPVMPTLHPAYLLRRPIDKRLAWRDMQEIAAKVNLLGLLEEQGAGR